MTSFAQVDKPYFPDNSHTIYVPKRTILYIPLGDYDVERIMEERNSDKWTVNSIGYLQSLKKIKVSNNIELPVVGFIKSEADLEDYDFYIVDYKGQLCYLSKDFCIDNTLIDTKNSEIKEYYQSLKREIETLSNKFVNSVERKAKRASAEMTILNDKKNEIIDSLTANQIATEEREVLKKYNEWLGSDETRRKASETIIIHRSTLSKPNSAAGCDYSMSFTNNSAKTIKYLDWEGRVYNAVNDVVLCEIRDISVFQGRLTGPVASNVERSGIWETIIYNWSAKELKLSGISIIYTDGTKAYLSTKEISSIINAPYKNLSSGRKALIESHIRMDVNQQIDSLKTISNYLSVPENARFSALESMQEERELYEHIFELAREFMRFRRNNSLQSWDLPVNVKKLVGAHLY